MRRDRSFEISRFKEFVKDININFGNLAGYYLPSSPWGELSLNDTYKTLKTADEILSKFKEAVRKPEKVDAVTTAGILVAVFLPVDIFICFKDPFPHFLFITLQMNYSKTSGETVIIQKVFLERDDGGAIEIVKDVENILEEPYVSEVAKKFLLSNLELFSC